MTNTTCETCSKSSVCKFIDDFRQTEDKAQNLIQNSRLTPIEVRVVCKEHTEFPVTVRIDGRDVAQATKRAVLDGIGG